MTIIENNNKSEPIVEFRHNGDVYIKGELLEKEVGVAFKELLYPNIQKSKIYDEMLEMLKDILNNNRQYWGEEENSADQIYEVEQLIKKATS